MRSPQKGGADNCQHQGRLMLGGSAHEHIGEAKQTNELHKQENDI